MTKRTTNIDRIIAKIDNDFNPDNSDWIPRVGAWVYDALGLLNVNTVERVKEKFKVHNRIAYSKCELKQPIKVYDKNGCEIKELDNINESCGCGYNIPSTGEQIEPITVSSSNTTDIIINPDANDVPDETIIKNIGNGGGIRYNVVEVWNKSLNHNYVLVDCKNIELNFDTDCIIVEHDKLKCSYSDIYNCDLPDIPDNAKVIEYLTYYCMYKMLLRGYRHPIFNLAASQYGTNPYYIAKTLEEEAKRSLINDGTDENLDNLWRSAFFIGTFDPKH